MTRALLEIAEYFETISEEASKMELLNWIETFSVKNLMLSWDSVLMKKQRPSS